MTNAKTIIARNTPKNAAEHTRHVTLRAALAIDCTDLASNLKHLVHVMALHADNPTGVGLYSQKSLGKLMSCSDRNVRKLQDKLDAAWERGESPVRITYERRYNKSSRYTITVKDDAVLNLRDRPAKESSGTTVPVNLPESTGTMVPDNADSTGTAVPLRPGLEFRSTPSEPEPQGLLSSETSSSERSSQNKTEPSEAGAHGANAPRAETQPETTEAEPCGVCLVLALQACRGGVRAHARDSRGLAAAKVASHAYWAQKMARSAEASDHKKLVQTLGADLARVFIAEAKAKAKAAA